MAQVIIGLTGLAGAGKDTVAEYLEQLSLSNGVSVERVAFAGHLKKVMACMFAPFGITEEYFNDRRLKEQAIPGFSVSPRQLMQKFGTDFVRNMIHSDFWLMTVEQLISASEAQVVLITDVRFENEAQLVRDLGGVVLHVTGRTGSLNGAAAAHSSESGVALADEDLILYNDASLDTLASKVVALFWTRVIWRAHGLGSRLGQVLIGGNCDSSDPCQPGNCFDTDMPRVSHLEDVA